MITWVKARPVLEAEMKRQNVSRNELAVKTELPASTVYSVFDREKNSHVYVDTLALILHALGKSFGWIEKELADRAAARKKAAAGAA